MKRAAPIVNYQAVSRKMENVKLSPSVFVCGFLILLLSSCGCQNNDSIEVAGRETQKRLSDYQSSGDARDVLLSFKRLDGAPGQQSMYVFVDWSISNKKDFEKLCQVISTSFSEREQNNFAEILVYVGTERNSAEFVKLVKGAKPCKLIHKVRAMLK